LAGSGGLVRVRRLRCSRCGHPGSLSPQPGVDANDRSLHKRGRPAPRLTCAEVPSFFRTSTTECAVGRLDRDRSAQVSSTLIGPVQPGGDRPVQTNNAATQYCRPGRRCPVRPSVPRTRSGCRSKPVYERSSG
jgi:hypothetical protein